MIAGAELATNHAVPVRHIPLEALGGDMARLLQRDDADILGKGVWLAVVTDVNKVLARLEEKGQTGAREQEYTAIFVFKAGLVHVKLVKLADTLVDSAAKTTQGDNVGWPVSADPVDGLAEICTFLIRIMDNLCRLRL